MNFGITFIKGDIELPSLDEDGTIRYAENQLHTYRDWGLIPASRPVVELPEVKTSYVECDALDGGGIDVTEALTGYPLYKNRAFEQTFYRQGKDNWPFAFDKIFNWLHGQKIKMILDDDPSHFYTGRISIKELKSDQYWSEITISGDLDPFKYYVYKSDDLPMRNIDGKVEQYTDRIIHDLIDYEAGYDSFGNAIFQNGTYQGSASYDISAGIRPVTPKVYIQVTPLSGSSITSCLFLINGTNKATTIPKSDFGKWTTLYGLRIPPNTKQRIIIYFMEGESSVSVQCARIKFSYRKGML